MTMPQHQERERFLLDHINQGASLLMRTLANATEALDAIVDQEDDVIALRREGDLHAAASADAMVTESRRKYHDAMSWSDTLSERIGETLLRLALGRDDIA